MRASVRLTAFVLLIAVAVWLCGSAVYGFVVAARGNTGDTARSVPVMFGLIYLSIGIATGYGAWRLGPKKQRPDLNRS